MDSQASLIFSNVRDYQRLMKRVRAVGSEWMIVVAEATGDAGVIEKYILNNALSYFHIHPPVKFNGKTHLVWKADEIVVDLSPAMLDF